MEVNISALEKLLFDKFENNQTLFAKKLGIERSHVNKVFKNKGKGAGAIFCGAVIKYCNENNLNYQNYIFFNNKCE